MLVITPYTWCYYLEWVYNKNSLDLPFEAMDQNTSIQIIKRMLDEGYYCIGKFNEKYAPGYRGYQARDFSHQFSIYSIDIDNELLGTFGYSKNGQLDNIDVSFNDFYKALSVNEKEVGLYLHFVTLNPNFNYDCFDLQFLKVKLKTILIL